MVEISLETAGPAFSSGSLNAAEIDFESGPSLDLTSGGYVWVKDACMEVKAVDDGWLDAWKANKKFRSVHYGTVCNLDFIPNASPHNCIEFKVMIGQNHSTTKSLVVENVRMDYDARVTVDGMKYSVKWKMGKAPRS